MRSSDWASWDIRTVQLVIGNWVLPTSIQTPQVNASLGRTPTANPQAPTLELLSQTNPGPRSPIPYCTGSRTPSSNHPHTKHASCCCPAHYIGHILATSAEFRIWRPHTLRQRPPTPPRDRIWFAGLNRGEGPLAFFLAGTRPIWEKGTKDYY